MQQSLRHRKLLYIQLDGVYKKVQLPEEARTKKEEAERYKQRF